jgi:predicted DNA-binding transcriptional regulator AlpA
MWKDGDITVTDFAKLIGVSKPTIYKYIEEFEVV